jgi:hypothetical protein
MDWLIGIGGCIAVVVLAAVLVSLFHLFSRGVNAASYYVEQRYGRWLKRRRPAPNVVNAPQPLRLRRFSRSRPTPMEAIAELLWFAEEKHQRDEIIFGDDLPRFAMPKEWSAL